MTKIKLVALDMFGVLVLDVDKEYDSYTSYLKNDQKVVNKELLEFFKEKDLDIALVSNADNPTFNYYLKDYRDDFKYIILSKEVGYSKPDIRIFECLSKSSKVALENIAMIDDLPSNLVELRKFSDYTHVYKNNQETIKWISEELGNK